ncbi:MAG TPA: hypothetical protein HPP87_07990 [Planctomycetes bacterium]|nr:hypothetical protein [Planctomycetota bacterium]
MCNWKSKNLIKCFFVVCIAGFLSAGCSDNPENKAAKQLRQNAQKALDTAAKGDIEKAARDMQAVLKDAPAAGPAAQPFLLVDADIVFEKAQRKKSELAGVAETAGAALDEISLQAERISRLTFQKERLNHLLDATNREIEQLFGSITGDSQSPGIEEELAAAGEELSRLEELKVGFEQQRQAAQDSINAIEQQADRKLREAESAYGDEKLRLAQAGYDLLLTRKSHFLDAQAAADQIRSIESQIEIVKPLIQKLQSDLVSVRKRIDDLKNAAHRQDSKVQLADADRQIEEHAGRIAWLTTDLKKLQQNYSNTVDEAVSLFQKAADRYKKVKAQSVRKSASASLADCYWRIALARLDGMKFHFSFSSRLNSTAGALESSTSNTLGDVASQYERAGSEYAQKARESFNIATDEYSKLQKRFGGRDEFACNLLKNYMLTLYGKMSLAEFLDEQSVVDEVLTQADELMEKASDCDPAFQSSVTAALFDDSVRFVPSMTVDGTIYYNELKKEFQAWKTLRGAEQQAEVNRLLAMLDSMAQPVDEEAFERIIGPERKQLEEVLARGFKEAAEAEGGEDVGGYGDYSDPNYF